MSALYGVSNKTLILTKNCLALKAKLGGVAALRNFSATQQVYEKHDCKVLIIGGGAGGCALAAKLSSKLGRGKVIVVEPADRHYYQPLFTLIGGGIKSLKDSYKLMSDVLPKKAKWLKESAIYFDPKSNMVTTSGGNDIKYDMLLIASGLKLKYDTIPGLVEGLSIPHGKVCSVYSPDYVDRTYDAMRSIENGNAIFTFPNTPVKCPGAPQKILYIAEHYLRKTNKRNNVNVIYNTSLPVLFGVKYYADVLWPICKNRNIQVNTRRNLIEVKPDKDIAVFENLDKPEEKFEENYSLLHAVPPMGTHEELAKCRELVNEAGFVEVNPSSMQHIRYKNVFAIGDCSSSPNSKTAAATAAQSPVVYHNMLAVMDGKRLEDSYDGYASCPLVTGYNTCILAEFDYNLQPLETFPIDQKKERYSMFFMKKVLMPTLYWNMMLKGYWNGPALMRNAFSIFKFGTNKI